MRKKPKGPPVPPARLETVRREIVSAIEGRTLTARDISHEARVPEKDVCGHLVHIRKTLGKGGRELVVIPAECDKCGFVFKKRERLTRPGRCPVCRATTIREPEFGLKKAGGQGAG
jgi:predicted Zn-ribbon and HTH transcriptional regulator